MKIISKHKIFCYTINYYSEENENLKPSIDSLLRQFD